MCGIAGFSLSDDDRKVINSNTLAAELLLGIEPRGRDASGACWTTNTNTLMVQKAPKTASDLVNSLSVWRKAPAAILHTRAWTQGPASNNLNNHPIRVANIVGVHNGMVENDYEVFDTLGIKRQAEVDSEAIFAALAFGPTAHPTKDRERLPGCRDAYEALEYIEAGMAIAWMYDEKPDTLYLAKGDSNPLIMVQTPGGSLVFASTESAIKRALDKVGQKVEWQYEAGKGDIFVVRKGMVTESSKFDPGHQAEATGWDWGWSRYRSNYTRITNPTPHSSAGTGSGRGYTTTYSDTSPASPASTSVDGTMMVWSREFTGYPDADLYERRARAVKEFYYDVLSWFADCENPDHEADDYVRQLGSDLCTGDWVRTRVGGVAYNAQVVKMPNQFPDGDYTLRVFVTDTKDISRPGGVDVCLVRRTYGEIEIPFGPGELDTVTDAYGYDAEADNTNEQMTLEDALA